MQNTTHTVQIKQPNPLSELPRNKAAQFVVGLVAIFVAFKLWWAGWFSAQFAAAGYFQTQPVDGLGSPIGLLPFALDAVCLVGIVVFAAVGFIADSIGPLIVWGGDWIRSTAAGWTAAGAAAEQTAQAGAGDQAQQQATAAASAQLDVAKLQNVLSQLAERIEQLETGDK